jgi:hypothetical protein
MGPERNNVQPIEYVCGLFRAYWFKLVALYVDYAGILE